MAASFFFYDLETSGLDPKGARIMQFAGQRTNMDLQPVDEAVNLLIRLAPDVLPEPDAILVTGITPQATLSDGITEAAFLKFFYESVVQPGTIFLGYNSVRFDDEFMRYLHYRNFYDAYRWQWCDSCSRWDLLDVVRMTRALRPDGIVWPFGPDGKPTNRLELLTKMNKIDHFSAHDALSDVHATIAVTRLIKEKQPKLFEFLLEMRDKKKVAALVNSGQPFAYSAGSYPSEYEKTTLAVLAADLPNGSGALVYDLRYDPTEFLAMSVEQLEERWRWRKDRPDDEPALPVKALRFNQCPAVAPYGVIDTSSARRLRLNVKEALSRVSMVTGNAIFAQKLLQVKERLFTEGPQGQLIADEHSVDGQLYDGFLDVRDQGLMSTIREASPTELAVLAPEFHDSRLTGLWPLYKARNFPELLSSEERMQWEKLCSRRLMEGGEKSRLAKYFQRLQTLLAMDNLPAEKQYILEELRLYGQSIMPSDEA